MSSSTFRSHGLIKSPAEEALYRRAHIANIYSGIADPKEHETSALMEVILYSHIFTIHENFIVNSQQPPARGSEKRCDIVIRYLEHGTEQIRVLCFVECKRARTSQMFSLKALEKQAIEYCRLCLESEEDMPYVYAATMAGAHIRLWTCWRDQDKWVPFWGSNHSGDWSHYKDVGDDTAGREIEYWFEQMKKLPPTPHFGQSSDSYGASSTVALGYQASPSGLQAPIPAYQASASSYQASSSGLQAPVSTYQASASNYQASSSGLQAPVPTPSYQASTEPQAPVLSYQASSLGLQAPVASYQASTSSYQASTGPAPSYQTPTVSQTGLHTISPSLPGAQPVEIRGQDQSMSENVDDDNMDDQIEEEAETRQAATSSEGYDYHVVKVTRIPHTFSKDEFNFKGKGGKRRQTQRDDWEKISYKGRPAWIYHNYVSFQDIFE